MITELRGPHGMTSRIDWGLLGRVIEQKRIHEVEAIKQS